jgi:flagellar hook-associated protein 2
VAVNLTGGQALGLAQTMPAADAQLNVNGITITKSSNTISDVIDGVTLNLKAKTSSAVNVTVNADTNGVVSALNDLVSAYNDVNSLFSAQFTYNSTTETAGVLSGDSTLRSIQTNLQSVFMQSISQVGLSFNNDGSLTLDETKLSDALSSDATGVAALLLGDGAASIAVNLQTALKNITDPLSGPIENAKDGLNKNISDINNQIDAYNARLAVTQQMLTDEFNQANEALQLMSSTQSSLTNLLTSLSKTQ